MEETKRIYLKNICGKIHFGAVALTIFNLLLRHFSPFSFNEKFAIIIHGTIAITGILLFFLTVKPFKKQALYFGLYFISGMLVLFGGIVRGIFGALVLSILLFPFYPANHIATKNGFTISSPFQGFMGRCCNYAISESKFLFFQKNYGLFQIESQIAAETLSITTSETEIFLEFSTMEGQNYKISKDK